MSETSRKGAGFERSVSKEVDDHLPGGWEIETPTDKRYDMIARSPKGHIFPIELKGGSGLLDVSTVVDFGSEVENDVEKGSLRKSSSIPEPTIETQDIIVKPVIATNREIAPASSDYASTFHIAVVSSPEIELTETIVRDIEHERISRLGQELVSRLTELDDLIQTDKLHSQSAREEKAPARKEDWYRMSSK